MSGCDRMTTPLGILGLSFAICFFFIAKLYLSYCFLFLLVVAMLSLSSFIYFALFTILACIVFRVYHAYILDMDLRFSRITYLILICVISTLR